MQSSIDIVNRYYQAINDADWGVYEELFSDDATLEAPGGITGVGPAAMRAFDQVWKTAAPDFTITPLTQVADGLSVLSENAVVGTHTATLNLGPAGVLTATGKQFGGKYVGVFEVTGGKISAQHVYYDRMIVVEQLGMPQPAEATV